MKRLLPFLPLAALALLVIVSVLLLTRGGERQTVSDGWIGRPAPAMSLARLNGGAPVTGDDVVGRPYVINVFASWCVPCRAEHAQLMSLQARGVDIVGVAYKDDAADTAAFLTELGNPFHAVGLDPEGRFGLELGVAGVPETFVVGADGRIVAVHRGPLTERDITNSILPALGRR